METVRTQRIGKLEIMLTTPGRRCLQMNGYVSDHMGIWGT